MFPVYLRHFNVDGAPFDRAIHAAPVRLIVVALLILLGLIVPISTLRAAPSFRAEAKRQRCCIFKVSAPAPAAGRAIAYSCVSSSRAPALTEIAGATLLRGFATERCEKLPGSGGVAPAGRFSLVRGV